ncbi:MAG: hypothetical protein MUE73_06005 [Planctomycetes bacterium]|jgi:hypothetical protein|nr:hypothetical protein [Planctomycetota bacterium]
MSPRFLFGSPKFQMEVSGSEEFVAEYIALARDQIGSALSGVAEVDIVEPAAGDPPAPPAQVTLETFYQASQLREGRGALQDSILVFGLYLQEKQGKPEFTIEDLNFCFDLVGMRRPKSLANTLGIMKRDRHLLQGGSRRGAYVLSDRGHMRARRCSEP